MGQMSLSVAPYDARYTPNYGPTTQFAETIPRWAATAGVIAVAGTVHLRRITIPAGTFTTVTVDVTAAAGSLTNCFLGLYNVTTLAKVVASADAAATFGTNTGPIPVAFSASLVNAATADYYVAFLAGGGTPPTLACHGAAASTLFSNGFSPTIADRHATGSLTALPDPVVLLNATTAIAPSCFYARVT